MKRNAEVGLPRKSILKSPQPPLLKGEWEDAGISPPLEKGAGGISFHIGRPRRRNPLITKSSACPEVVTAT